MLIVIKPSRSLAADRRGNSAIEYALIASVMAAMLVTTMPVLGKSLVKAFSTIVADFNLVA